MDVLIQAGPRLQSDLIVLKSNRSRDFCSRIYSNSSCCSSTTCSTTADSQDARIFIENVPNSILAGAPPQTMLGSSQQDTELDLGEGKKGWKGKGRGDEGERGRERE